MSSKTEGLQRATAVQPIRAPQGQHMQARRRETRHIPWIPIAALLVLGGVAALILSGAFSVPNGRVLAATTSHDFGQIPVTGGTVITKFPLTVQGEALATDITSTCMCTQGRLVQGDSSSDWFGMQHDGPLKTLSFKLVPDKPAYLEVRVDPAAHGLDSLGPIQRGVTLQLGSGQLIEFDLKANVVK